MMNINLVSLLICFTAALSAQAQGGGGQTGSGENGHHGGGFLNPREECEKCSNAPVLASSLTYEEAQETFASATTPTPEQLVGKWIWVIQVDDPALGSRARLAVGDDADDRGGFANSDGSVQEVVFRQAPPSDFSPVRRPTISYEMRHLGKREANQGPYAPLFNEGSVCLSEFAYSLDGEMFRAASKKFQCRLIATRSDLMICAGSIEGNWSGNGPEISNIIGKQVSYLGLAKVGDSSSLNGKRKK